MFARAIGAIFPPSPVLFLAWKELALRICGFVASAFPALFAINVLFSISISSFAAFSISVAVPVRRVITVAVPAW